MFYENLYAFDADVVHEERIREAAECFDSRRMKILS
jgi:hypothetical protein